MSKEKQKKSYYPSDWRIGLGLVISISWLLLGLLYIANSTGLTNFASLPIGEMGSFLEGAFAPIAFLWLVIGLFVQQSVLAENNEELRRNNLHSQKQTEAIAATEMNARQETFFIIATNTRKQLGGITGLLFISSQGPIGNKSYDQAQLGELWHQFAQGDFEIFSRLFLSLQATEGNDLADLFYGTELRMRHTNNFIVSFDRLLKMARECDTDNIIQDALIYSAHGLLNNHMRNLHPKIEFDPIVATDSGQYLSQTFALRKP